MAGVRVSYAAYAFLSTLSFLAVILRTWYVHEELYSVVAVLSTGKIALALLYNFAFMVLLGVGKVTMQLMVGQLRDLEVEHVLDSGRGFLLDTVLFLVLSSPTLDGAEVTTHALAKYIFIVVALKTAHLVIQIRGATMFEVGSPRATVLLRMCLVLFSLLLLDIFAVHFFFVNASKASTFYLWLLFECLGMFVSCAVSILKFGMHVIDLRLDNGWASKSAVIFYLELVHDVTSLAIFLLFMSVFFVTQPSRLPLYMTADIIHVVKALYKRILSFKKYRSLTRNLETRFPDASHEELEAADTCIICRDLLFEGSKRLPCSHVFHVDCLRSWLVQQQSCPTCRADIPADDAAGSAAPVDQSADGRGEQSGSDVEAEQRPDTERGASDLPTSFPAEPTSEPPACSERIYRRVFAEEGAREDGYRTARAAKTQGSAVPAFLSSKEPTTVSESTPGNSTVPSCAAQALVQALQISYQICEFYRVHASMWAIESQRAHLEAARLVGLRALARADHSETDDREAQVPGRQMARAEGPAADVSVEEKAAASPVRQQQTEKQQLAGPKEYIVVCPSHLFEHPGGSLLLPAARQAAPSQGTQDAFPFCVTSSEAVPAHLTPAAHSGRCWPGEEGGVSRTSDSEGIISTGTSGAVAESSPLFLPGDPRLQYLVSVDASRLGYPAADTRGGARETQSEREPAAELQKAQARGSSADRRVSSVEVPGDLERMRQEHHQRWKSRNNVSG